MSSSSSLTAESSVTGAAGAAASVPGPHLPPRRVGPTPTGLREGLSTALAPRACRASSAGLDPAEPPQGAVVDRSTGSADPEQSRRTPVASPRCCRASGAAVAVAQSGAGPAGLPQPALSWSERGDAG